MTVNPGGSGGGGRSGRVNSISGSVYGGRGGGGTTGANGTFLVAGSGGAGDKDNNDGGAGGDWGESGGAGTTAIPKDVNDIKALKASPGTGGLSVIVSSTLDTANTLYTKSINYSSRLTSVESYHSIEFLGNFLTNAISNVYSFRITSYNIANFWFGTTNILSTSNAFSRKGSATLNVGTLQANTFYPIRIQFGTDATIGNIKFEVSESNATFNKAYTVNTSGWLFSTSNTGYLPGLEMKRYSGFYNQNNAFFVPANDWTANANNYLTMGGASTIHLPQENAIIGKLYFNIGNPTFVSYSANSMPSGSSVAVAKPTGIQNGDMLVITLKSGSSTTNPSLPTGFSPFFNAANTRTVDASTQNTDYFFGLEPTGRTSSTTFGNMIEGYRIVDGTEADPISCTVSSGGSAVAFAVRNANTIFSQTRPAILGVNMDFSVPDSIAAPSNITFPLKEQFVAYANQLSVFVTTCGPLTGSVTNMTANGTDSFTYTKGATDSSSKFPIGIGYKKFTSKNTAAKIEVTPTRSSNSDDPDIFMQRRFNFL